MKSTYKSLYEIIMSQQEARRENFIYAVLMGILKTELDFDKYKKRLAPIQEREKRLLKI